MKVPISIFASLVAGTGFHPGAFAEELEIDMGHIVALEPRLHRLVHEIRASVGVLPLDAFHSAVPVGAAYILHLSDRWAWEVINFDYAIRLGTGVESTLREQWSIAPAEERPVLEYLLGTHLLLTPFYGKLALFNEDLLYVDTHFAVGGGLARYGDGFHPQIGVSPGLRFFFGSLFSARLDVRAYAVPTVPGGIDFLIGIFLSGSASFGARRVTEDEAPKGDPQRADGFEILDRRYPKTTPEEKKRS